MNRPSVKPRRKLSRQTSTDTIRRRSEVWPTPSRVLDNNDDNDDDEKFAERRAGERRRTVDKTTSCTQLQAAGRKLWGNPGRFFANVTHARIHAPINEEGELISMLTRQLYLAETQSQRVQESLARTEEKLKTKEVEISRLKRKVRDWEAKNRCREISRKREEQRRREQLDQSEYLYKRCLVLEQKILEMEKFLSDYGLVWVGEEGSSEKPPETIANDYINNCFEQLSACVEQLNFAAGKGELHVHRDEKGSGASFKTPSCVSLKFYKDGMILRGGPLRPYTDPATGCFIRDILDGFFPSELQRNYPNGVPFKMEDRRTEIHGTHGVDFPGHGYRLGKQISPEKRTPFTSSCKANKIPQRTNPLPPENFSTDEVNDSKEIKKSKTTPPSARSLKSKSSTEKSSIDILNLRTQILASHNNNCSNTHLQSHINAELALSSRREKRDPATRSSDCDSWTQDSARRSRVSSGFTSAGRSSNHSSTDRSSINVSGRTETPQEPRKLRGCVSGSPVIRGRRAITCHGDTENLKRSTLPTRRTQPTSVRKNAPPILHQVNEPTGGKDELRLKVRSLNGGTIYMVHVSANESVAGLYQLLNKAMTRPSSGGYKIVISGYSTKRLDQPEMTLRESGITRDCVLHLVND